METCRYIVARFVPDPVRDEAINIGVVLQCTSRKFVACRFLDDFARVRRIRPDIETPLLRKFSDEFQERVIRFSDIYSQPFIPEPLEHESVIEASFLDNLSTQYGNRFQFTSPRGTLATDPIQELNHLFGIFVAEKQYVPKRPRITHSKLRDRLYTLFDRSQLLAANLIKYEFVLPGKVKQDGWQFDFGRDDHNISIYQSIALDALGEEDKIDRALVLEGRIKDVRAAINHDGKQVNAYALTYSLPQDSPEYVGTTEARKILLNGDIDVVHFDYVPEFIDRLRVQLLGAGH